MACTAISVAAITSSAGKIGDAKYVGVGLMHAYLASVKTKSKYPGSPPPWSLLNLLAFVRNLVLRWFSDLLVGSLLMGVGIGYLKYDAA